MNSILTHAHSSLRWVAIILLLLAIVNAFTAKTYEKKHKMINLFAMVTLHTQLLIGLAQYFFTSKKVFFGKNWMKEADGMYRFFGMEHLIGMLAAIVVITIGRKIAEKQESDLAKHKKIRMYYVIGFILILAFIPWPFRENLHVTSWF
jgi:ABC-type branched-subunit amino acid transport system permease subunit